jgi:hypothetical protein
MTHPSTQQRKWWVIVLQEGIAPQSLTGEMKSLCGFDSEVMV